MEIVAVRAVNFSIRPFCTEFRCERFCGDDIFPNWGREIDHRGREINHQVGKSVGKCGSWGNVVVDEPPEFFFGSGGLVVWLQ